MKTILYATDRKETSALALRYAHDLSISLGVNIIVLYVHQLPPIRLSVSRLPDQIEYEVIKEQKDILSVYISTHMSKDVDASNMQVEVVCNDSVLEGIYKKSTEIAPDIVLIGRKGKTTDRGIFAGDIAHGLIKRLECPVLTAPDTINKTPITNILYATDFEEADIAAIQKLIPIARMLAANIHVVHIATEKNYAGKELMEWFKEMLSQVVTYDYLEFKVIFSDNIVKKLNDYAQLVQADLLAALYREEKGFFQNLFNKSLITKMDTQTKLPLLSFNKKK